MVEIKSNVYQEVCDAVADLFDQVRYIMPTELRKFLPPRRAVNHKIELEPSVVMRAKALYRMSLNDLVELRKQITYLLDCGMVQSSKVSFGLSVLFQKKYDGSLRMCIDYMPLTKLL